MTEPKQCPFAVQAAEIVAGRMLLSSIDERVQLKALIARALLNEYLLGYAAGQEDERNRKP